MKIHEERYEGNSNFRGYFFTFYWFFPSVTVGENTEVWKLTETKLSEVLPAKGLTASLNPGSFEYNQVFPNNENKMVEKSVSGSWAAPPSTLTPGGEVEISGRVSYTDVGEPLDGATFKAYFDEADSLDYHYGTQTFTMGDGIRVDVGRAKPRANLNGKLPVPSDSYGKQGQKINLRYITPSGAVNYIYTYTINKPPIGSVINENNLPCRCDEYSVDRETNNCLKYGKTEECSKCYWECKGGNPSEESVDDVKVTESGSGDKESDKQSSSTGNNNAEALSWNKKGADYCYDEKYDECLSAFKKAVEIDPTNGQYWANKGYALMKVGRDKEAIEAAEKAIELEPEDSGTWYTYAGILLGMWKYEEALKKIDKAIDLGSENEQEKLWSRKGEILTNIGSPEEIQEAYNNVDKYHAKSKN